MPPYHPSTVRLLSNHSITWNKAQCHLTTSVEIVAIQVAMTHKVQSGQPGRGCMHTKCHGLGGQGPQGQVPGAAEHWEWVEGIQNDPGIGRCVPGGARSG